jgi:hypothetical protein
VLSGCGLIVPGSAKAIQNLMDGLDAGGDENWSPDGHSTPHSGKLSRETYLAPGGVREIGARYEVSHSTVCKIKNRESYLWTSLGTSLMLADGPNFERTAVLKVADR